MQGDAHSKQPHRWKSHRAAVLCLLFAFCFFKPAPVQAGSTSREYELKAAFIYNFTKFIEWPDDAFSGPGSPIFIGILGQDPFGGALENAIRGRKVNGRPLVIEHLESAASARTAHIVFVSRAESWRLDELKGALQGASVLVVTETENEFSPVVAINFTLAGDKLRFEINMDAATAARLKVSAQLQKLAKVIQDKSS